MHFERGRVNQESWTDELLVQVMVAQHMANILAKKTLDALTKFLYALHVFLVNSPGPVGSVRFAGLEFLDAGLDVHVPGNVGDQILNQRERFHGLNGDGLLNRQRVRTCHAHELRHAVDFSRA